MKISWLLLKKSGKQSLGRLALTAGAVALGIAMVLVFMSGLNGVNNRSFDDRDLRGIIMNEVTSDPIDGVSPLKIQFGNYRSSILSWKDEPIASIMLHATGDSSPEIDSLPTPNANEYYVSSKLKQIIQDNPDENLGARFGTNLIGTIPDKYLPSPDTLMVVRGMTPAEAEANVDEYSATGEYLETIDAYSFAGNEELKSIRNEYAAVVATTNTVLLLSGATILLFPIIMFVSVATQLGSTQREKRYAAMRLVGATKAQVTRVMALESIAAALVGVIVGSLVHLVALPIMANYQIAGLRIWPEDLAIPASWYFIIAIVALLFCWLANWWGMRHVRTSPLGVTRTQKVTKKPRAWRLLPVIAGIGFFIWISFPSGRDWIFNYASEDPLALFLIMTAIVSTMFGLVVSGSWLTYRLSAFFAKHTKNASTLLATKRISSQSKQIFRSVSGVVLALFAGSFYLIAVSGIARLSISTINDNGYSQLKPDTAYIVLPEANHTNTLPSVLQKQSYIKSFAEAKNVLSEKYNGEITITCADLSTYTKRNCPSTAHANDLTQINFNASVISDDQIVTIDNLPDSSTYNTNYLVLLSSNDDLDKLRTLLIQEIGTDADIVSGTYEQIARLNPLTSELSSIVYAAMAITLFVAIASLIVSTIGGLLERKRSLATLKLSGMTIRQMKRMVIIESLIPLITVSLVAAGVGGWLGATFISIFSTTLKPTLSPLYFAIIFGGLAVAIIGIYCILPTLTKITSLEENQTE